MRNDGSFCGDGLLHYRYLLIGGLSRLRELPFGLVLIVGGRDVVSRLHCRLRRNSDDGRIVVVVGVLDLRGGHLLERVSRGMHELRLCLPARFWFQHLHAMRCGDLRDLGRGDNAGCRLHFVCSGDLFSRIRKRLQQLPGRHLPVHLRIGNV